MVLLALDGSKFDPTAHRLKILWNNRAVSRLRSGKYQSASEVVREALRLLEGRDQTTPASIKELKEGIEAGLAQLRRGEGVDGEGFFRHLAARRRATRARRA